MKKHIPLLAALCLAATAVFAQQAPTVPVIPLSQFIPTIPKGANTAALPLPRAEWFVRIKTNNDRAQKEAANIHLIFDGDSITDNWQSRGKDVWDAHYAKLGAFDFAIGGDRTEHLLWRLAEGQVDNLHPTLVVLMIGTNNLGGNTVDQIADGVATIVHQYRQRCPDATVLLQAIFPRSEKPTDPVRAKIKAINALISKLADGKHVLYVDFGDKFLQPDGTLTKDIMPDLLHPSPKGYEIWAAAIQPIIDTYFPPVAAKK